MKIYPVRERLIGEVVAEKAALHGERTFVSFEDRRYSYRDLDELSNRIANGLAQMEVKKGTHVAFMLDNKLEIVLIYFALAKPGAVTAPLNTAAKGDLLACYLKQSDLEMVIVDAALVGLIAAVRARTPMLRHIIFLRDEKRPAVDFDDTGLPHSDFDALLAASGARPATEVRFCDLHSLIYSSGTTGPSKGNLSTHAHALGCGLVLAQTFGYRSDEVTDLCLPLFHGNAWLCCLLPAFVADAQLMVSRRFSASGFWDEIRIADDDDFELPRGQSGEILLRSTQPWLHAQGCYNMPEATAESWRNLWFHSGDRGYLDADGYFHFVDRKKDAIRRRGENVSSFEVEQIILMGPQVLEVAAFPVASEHSEDEVMVSVVLRHGQRFSELELTLHCQENMAYFMVPRFIEFVSELPKTMTEKFKMRASAEQRLSALWDREKAGIAVAS